MSGKKVTESPEELVCAANADVCTIITLAGSDGLFNTATRGAVGVHGQQMAEKLLKAYLRKNEGVKDKVFHGHNLKIYIEQVKLLDKSFKDIESSIVKLNNCNEELRYAGRVKLNDEDFKEILDAIKNVYYFPVFSELFKDLDKEIGVIDNKYFDKIIEKHGVVENE